MTSRRRLTPTSALRPRLSEKARPLVEHQIPTQVLEKNLNPSPRPKPSAAFRLAQPRPHWRQCSQKAGPRMNKLLFAPPARAAAVLLALGCPLARAQQPSATAPQTAASASLNDALMARATALYSSALKTGLRRFTCQVHPDWQKIIASARNGAPQDADAAKAVLLQAVRITLHARLQGDSTLDWQPPDSAIPRTQETVDMLDHAHRSIDSTLDGVLKLWTPLVDGSLAESLSDDAMDVQQTGSGYLVRSKPAASKDKPAASQAHSVSEDFDQKLLLVHYRLVDAGSTASLAPAFEPGPQGLLVSSFDAFLQPAGAPATDARQMHIAFKYQPVAGVQIPTSIAVTLPSVVEMDFTLDGCAVNAP